MTDDADPADASDAADDADTPENAGDSGAATDAGMATDAGTADDAGPLTRAVRTVTPPYVGRPDVEMDALGWGYVAVLVLLLFPFLPFVLLVWGTVRLIEALTGQD